MAQGWRSQSPLRQPVAVAADGAPDDDLEPASASSSSGRSSRSSSRRARRSCHDEGDEGRSCDTAPMKATATTQPGMTRVARAMARVWLQHDIRIAEEEAARHWAKEGKSQEAEEAARIAAKAAKRQEATKVVDESAFVDDDDGHGSNQQENGPASAVGDTSSSDDDNSPWHVVPSFVRKKERRRKEITEKKMKRNIMLEKEEEEEKKSDKKNSRKGDDEKAGEAVRSEAPAALGAIGGGGGLKKRMTDKELARYYRRLDGKKEAKEVGEVLREKVKGGWRSERGRRNRLARQLALPRQARGRPKPAFPFWRGGRWFRPMAADGAPIPASSVHRWQKTSRSAWSVAKKPTTTRSLTLWREAMAGSRSVCRRQGWACGRS